MSTAALVPADAKEKFLRASGISAAELAARLNGRYGAISARALRAWLLEAGFAVETRGGLLQPTPAAIEIADSLHPRGVPRARTSAAG